VLQGVTLPSLVRLLKVRALDNDGDEAEAALIERSAQAAAEALNHLQDEVDFHVDVWDRLNAFPTDLLSRLRPQLSGDAQHGIGEDLKLNHAQFVLGLQRMLTAAREELLEARSERGVEPDMVDSLVRRLDLYSLPSAPR
jgi:CPA1 family monovalent cation:H+ antiporter